MTEVDVVLKFVTKMEAALKDWQSRYGEGNQVLVNMKASAFDLLEAKPGTDLEKKTTEAWDNNKIVTAKAWLKKHKKGYTLGPLMAEAYNWSFPGYEDEWRAFIESLQPFIRTKS